MHTLGMQAIICQHFTKKRTLATLTVYASSATKELRQCSRLSAMVGENVHTLPFVARLAKYASSLHSAQQRGV